MLDDIGREHALTIEQLGGFGKMQAQLPVERPGALFNQRLIVFALRLW
jgi:hypothetical protein